MSFLSFLLGEKKTSASVAKDRLQIILINERGNGITPDFLLKLQQKLVEVISKYVNINPQAIKVNMDRQDYQEIREVKIEMQTSESKNAAGTAAGSANRVAFRFNDGG